MRAIQVSPDVFHAIWSARQPGEDDENAILHRLLSVAAPAVRTGAAGQVNAPWVDRIYGVSFPDGFEVFRRFRGKDFRAKVVGGRWHLNGRELTATSINDLSAAAGTKTENGWSNWRYLTSAGQERTISELRSPEKVRRRAV